MSNTSQQAVPFVFQVSSALREFMLSHSGERTVDVSIGTPPTSAGIRAQQMELIFGVSENPFVEGSLEYTFFEKFGQMIYRMGKYEATGGRMELKDLFWGQLKDGESLTVVSGGEVKARELVALTKEENLIPGRDSVFDGVRILSDPLLERCALAIVAGPTELVKMMESLHTCTLGTPSAPQEDLFLFLRSPELKNYLENPTHDEEEDEHCLSEILEFISMLYHEPMTLLMEEGARLKKKFGPTFLKCFFPKIVSEADTDLSEGLPPVQMVCGNGGGRQALFTIEKILAKRGLGKMILFQPHWTYHNVYRQTDLVSLHTRENGEPDMVALQKTLEEFSSKNERTAITINSPNNPCGIIYRVGTLEQLLILCQKYNCYVIDDACYLQIVRSGEHRPSLLEVAWRMVKESRLESAFLKNIFVALTASKGLGMAGGRIGAAVFFDEGCVSEMEENYVHEFPNLMSFFLAHKLSANQSAFMNLLQEINREIDERVMVVTKVLNENGLKYRRPEGAFYLEIQVPLLEKSVNDMKVFTLMMAREKGVAWMPMEVFGGEKYALRLSLGGEKSLEQLREEIEIFVGQLKEFWLG